MTWGAQEEERLAAEEAAAQAKAEEAAKNDSQTRNKVRLTFLGVLVHVCFAIHASRVRVNVRVGVR